MPAYPGPTIAAFTTTFGEITGSAPKWTNTTYWEAASTQIDNASAGLAAEEYHQQFGDVVTELMPSNLYAISTRVRVFLTGSLVEAEHAQNIQGQVSGTEALPRQDCIVIQKKTGKFGRASAGRLFISGIAEAVQVNGEIANAYRASAKAIATFIGSNRTFAVLYHSRHWNRKLHLFEPITAAYAVIELKSRRDRMWYKGSTKI